MLYVNYGNVPTKYYPDPRTKQVGYVVTKFVLDSGSNARGLKAAHGIFFDTFYKYVFEPVPLNSSITADQFFEELNKRLADEYKLCKENEDIRKKCSSMNEQSTQQLFNFEGKGFVTNTGNNNQNFGNDADNF